MSFDVTTLALAKSYTDQHGGGGASTAGDFVIKMTVKDTTNGDDYTVTSCDATVEQIDAAVAAERRAVVIASYEGTILELPMVMGNQGYSYYFCAFMSEGVLLSSVDKIENTSSWAFSMRSFRSVLNKLLSSSHTHANRDTLDKLSDSNGKLQYNGSDVGLKGDKGDKGDPGADGKTPVKGTDYWTAADKAEIVNDTLAALPTWTGGSY